MSERVRYTSTAIRCRNRKAVQALIHDDPSVLFYCTNEEDDSSMITADNANGTTLLHIACEEYGWNDEIAFVLAEILSNNKHHERDGRCYFHNGLFQEMAESEMPLKLSLQAGSDLEKIICHLKEQYPSYLERNLDCLSQIIAEFCYDMTLLYDLVDAYGIRLLTSVHPKDGSSPLGFACYYQNEEMVRVLLELYHNLNNRTENRESCNNNNRNSLLQVQKRLLSPNNEGMSPLGHLLLSVGDPDAENAWKCVNICVRFFADNDNITNFDVNDDCNNGGNGISRLQQQRFPVLHLFLLHTWDALIAKKNCMKILDRIIQRFRIDLCVVDDETGNTVLSIVVEKLSICSPAYHGKKKRPHAMEMKILDYLTTGHPVVPSDVASNHHRPATTRDGRGRLPLHSACEHSLPWKTGLRSIVDANVPALESYDPLTRLPAFAHHAVGPKSDLDSIYELLRLHPGIIDTFIPLANSN